MLSFSFSVISDHFLLSEMSSSRLISSTAFSPLLTNSTALSAYMINTGRRRRKEVKRYSGGRIIVSKVGEGVETSRLK